MNDIESQAIEYAEALNDIADVLDMPTGATSAEIVKKARDRWANGIYTCHERCTRERCVERRKLNAMREALEIADECLSLIENVGHGAMMNDVAATRGIVLRALDSESAKSHLLGLVADIRAAVGDPAGKLMQDELVEHCRRISAVVAAARGIRHWHDREPDGMVVSKSHVFALWESLESLDKPNGQAQ